MRLALVALIAVFASSILAGCGSEAKAPVPADEPSYRIVYDGPARTPDIDAKSALFMRPGDKTVTIGTGAEVMREIFPKPDGATEIRQRPPEFTEEYLSRGWETEDEAVGWVSYSGQVVLILHTLHSLEEADLKKDHVERYTRYFSGIEPTVIQGKSARFWFWQDGSHRFMICAGKSRRGGIDVTLAIGDTAVMDALRMMPSKAEFDKTRADIAWDEDASKAAKEKSQKK